MRGQRLGRYHRCAHRLSAIVGAGLSRAPFSLVGIRATSSVHGSQGHCNANTRVAKRIASGRLPPGSRRTGPERLIRAEASSTPGDVITNVGW